MAEWLIVLVLEALGLWLLWQGEHSGDETQTAVGGVLVASVTFLFVFRLLVRVLGGRRSAEKPGKRGAIEPFDAVSPLIAPAAASESPLDLTEEVDDGPLVLTEEVGPEDP